MLLHVTIGCLSSEALPLTRKKSFWRRREGVEPSGSLTTPRLVLKTSGTTGHLPSPLTDLGHLVTFTPKNETVTARAFPSPSLSSLSSLFIADAYQKEIVGIPAGELKRCSQVYRVIAGSSTKAAMHAAAILVPSSRHRQRLSLPVLGQKFARA
jgi:hypothetical protein